MARTYDVLCMGRSSIDLYSNDVGAPFEEITSFAALVGGCPTNISVGTHRLGLNSALLTGLGDDRVGDFIRHFLAREGVELRFTPTKPGRRTSAVLLGIQPPDSFPLIYYRDNNADIQLEIDDVLAAPVADSRLLLISGTGLSKEPSRSATQFAAEQATASGTEVVIDLDYRPDQWHDPRAFGITTRVTLPLCDIAIGTEDEIKAATGAADPDAAVAALLKGVRKAVVFKRGGDGSTRLHHVRRGFPRRRPSRSRCSTSSARATPSPAASSTAICRAGAGRKPRAWATPPARLS